jgi:hypothetical protein
MTVTNTKPWWRLEPASVQSALRHVYTATGTGVAVLSIIGLSQGDASAIGVAVKQIGDGVVSIIAGAGTLIGIGSAVFAGWSATRKSRMAAFNADPEIRKIETVPGTPAQQEAADIPGNKVT